MRTLAGILAILLTGALGAQTHPNHRNGFAPNTPTVSGGIDHVSPYNGNLTLTIPISQTYQVSPLVGYSFTLIYNSTFWEFDTVRTNDPPGGLCEDGVPPPCKTTKASPILTSNAGIGWTFSLGRLYDPADPRIDDTGWVYESASGSRHKFAGTDPILYSGDSSRLRLRTINGYRVVEFPNGSQSWFEANGARWRLKQITDPHKATDGSDLNWVRVVYSTPSGGGEVWTITDSAGRSHTVEFTTRSYDGDSRPTLNKITLATFDGSAIWQFLYSGSMTTVARPCAALDGSHEIGADAAVPLLERIDAPIGNDYSFVYDQGFEPTCDEWTGLMQSVTLPTLGRIAFGWGRYQFPKVSAAEQPMQQARGVTSRTLFEPVKTGSTWSLQQKGQWTYEAMLDRPFSNDGPETPSELTTTVTDPDGNTTQYFYNVYPVAPAGLVGRPSEYGLPYSPLKHDGVTGRFESMRVKAAGTTLIRSEFVHYELDPGTSILPYNERNGRVASSRTRYNADNSYVDTDRTDYDGYGNYRTTTVSGSFGSTRISSAVLLPPTADLWLLGRPSSSSTSENGVTTRSQFCYDGATGVLTRRRLVANLEQTPGDIVDPPASDDVVDIFEYDQASRGNVKSQKTYGGDTGTLPSTDLCTTALNSFGTAAMHLEHTYSLSSTLVSSRYHDPASGTALTFKSVDNTVNANTGLVSISRDTAGKATTYDYDNLGRLESVKPPGETEMTFVYGNPSLSGGTFTPATVTTRRGTEDRTVESYDGFGRLIREKRIMPDGSSSIRGQGYDDSGRLSWTSGFEAVSGSTSDVNFTPAHTTTYNYDASGRPSTVTGPDGSSTVTTYTGHGVRETTITQSVSATSNRTRTERYDHQGRLTYVADAGSPAATYGYDVGGRLASVTMSAHNVTQQRTFNYDGRGFLRSEDHPENGTSEYEYDARGRLLTRKHRNGAGQTVIDATFEYDAAERTASVKNAGGQVLKEFQYGTSGSNNGKLFKAMRYNRHPALGEIVVTDTYEYSATHGRAQARTTDITGRPSFRTAFTYDAEGQLWKVTYPPCPTCAGAPPRVTENGYTKGFLTSVSDGHESSAVLSYHGNGLLESVTRKLGTAFGPVWTQTSDAASGLPRPSSIAVTDFCDGFTWQLHPSSSEVSSGTTVNLSASAQGATNYQWFERVGEIDTQLDGKTGPTLSVIVSSTRQFFVRARNGMCSSDSAMATITVQTCTAPDPAISVTAAAVGPQQQFQASVADAGAQATYTWNVANGTVVSGGGTRTVQILAGCSGMVSVSVIVSACTSSPGDSHQVPITPPAVTVVSRPDTMPVKSNGSVSIAPIAGATYAWSITNGQITSATNQATVQFSSSCNAVSLSVTATLSCGASDSETISIPVTGAPTATLDGATITIDQGQNTTLALTLTGSPPWTVHWDDGAVTHTPPSSRTVSPWRPTRYELVSVSDANCSGTASGTVLVQVLPPPPVGLVATATGSSTIQLNWSFTGLAADRYRIERRAGGGYAVLGETAAMAWLDTTAAPGTVYLYRVRTITESSDNTAISLTGPTDLATAIVFADDPIATDTFMKAQHLIQLRTAVNSARALAGLAPAVFSDPDLSGMPARTAHILELRTALQQARNALVLPAVSFTDPALADGHFIRVLHIAELRGGVR